MCSAWNLRSASVHSPGTTMMGETPPSSAVMGFFSSGRFSRRRRFPVAPVPQVIASNIAAEPVMCTCTSFACDVRYEPTSPPPRTMRRNPGSISGANARSKTGTSVSWVGFTFSTAVRLYASNS